MGDLLLNIETCKPESTISGGITKFCNARGRPDKSKVIQFGPQPKSFISQLLQKNGKNTIKFKEYTDLPVSKQTVKNKKDEERSCNKKDYKRHLDIHKMYPCEYPKCTYTTKLSSNLVKHKRKHTSEKPFLCDQCTFRTNFINSLTVHKRIHTSERPYACTVCSYKCNSSSNLKKHCLHRHLKETS